MMKLVLFSIFCCAVWSFPVEQFSNIFPIGNISGLIKRHLKDDNGFQAAVKYFKTPEWNTMIINLRKSPDWQAYKQYVHENGIDIDSFIQRIERCLNSTDTSSFNNVDESQANFDSFMTDLTKDYTLHMIQGIKQMSSNQELKSLMEKITNEKGVNLMKRALGTPEMNVIVEKLESFNLPVKNLLNFVQSLLHTKVDN